MTGTITDRPASPPIDRRIRARRIEVRRREGRRRLHRLLALVVVSAVLLAGWGLVRSPLLDVDEIAVVGADHTEVADVLATLGIEHGDALVDVDVDDAAARVVALPWVSRVDVERSWGGRVDVTIVERTPDIVVVDPDGTSWLVDDDGAVLGPVEDQPDASLVAVEGIDVPPPGGVVGTDHAVAIGLATALPESLRPLVAAVEADRDGETWIRLVARPGEVDEDGAARADGGRVRIGDGRDLADQLRSLTTVLTQVDLTDLVVLDVRVPANPVVTRTSAPAEEIEPDDGAG